MRSTPAQDQALQQRLADALARCANGNADELGRMLGYANGGYVREILKGKKPVREAVIERANRNPALAGIFDGVLAPVSIADVQKRPAPAVWPFRDLSQARWNELDERDKGAIEAAAVKEWQAIQERRRALGELSPGQAQDRRRRASA